MSNKEQLLNDIGIVSFVLVELGLYLDTHPTDAEAMNFYRYARQANREAVRAYEQVYGPLMITQVDSKDWSWMKNPWPWEGGMRGCGGMKKGCSIR